MSRRRFFYDCEFIERPSTIDLISIGVVGEDGSEFYAVSDEFDESAAGLWVQENVLTKLPPPAERVPRAEIRAGLLDFLRPSKEDKVEMWGYYSAYDHVALCWLFGPMVDLPPGMPPLTMDVRQLAEQHGNPRLPAKPANAHDALADARWTREAWLFLAGLGATGA